MSTKKIVEKARKIREYMYRVRENIKLLCFSRDTEFEDEDKAVFENSMNLMSSEYRNINVIGRGFSLPRMWSQYAANNTGVCFIFDKNKLLSKVEKLGHTYMAREVDYKALYAPYSMDVCAIEEIYKIVTASNRSTAINTMIDERLDFVAFDFFTKLSDWSSENEYRILLVADDNDGVIKLRKINEAIAGIVLGTNTSEVNRTIIIVSDKNNSA